MPGRVTVVLLLILSACVTVNIYFPAAAVQRAADEIVKETWGGSNGKSERVQPQSLLPFAPHRTLSLSLTREVFAQEADINVSNPAIRGLRDSIKRRSGAIKPYMDKGSAGINQDGLLVVRSSEGLSLKERAEVQQLIEAENRDREALYAEIAKANNIPPDAVPKIKGIFAKSWIDQAQTGWWIQDSQGNWKRK
ncbi:MAG: putative rane protein [Deltaproteobacteria bacterium]|nr:putative rane protein [Deltaproteobacteria bacterium]